MLFGTEAYEPRGATCHHYPLLQRRHALAGGIPRKRSRQCSERRPTKVASQPGDGAAGQTLCLPPTCLFCLGMHVPESATCLTKLTFKTQTCKSGVALGGNQFGYSPSLLPREVNQPPEIKKFFPEKLQGELFTPGIPRSIQTVQQQPRAASSGVP